MHNQNLIDIRDEKQQKHTHTDWMKNNIAVIDSILSKLMIMNQYFFLQWIYTLYIYDKPSACLITSSTNVSISSNSFQRKKIIVRNGILSVFIIHWHSVESFHSGGTQFVYVIYTLWWCWKGHCMYEIHFLMKTKRMSEL